MKGKTRQQQTSSFKELSVKLLELTLEGFRSFEAEQSLDFSAFTPGLYHVTGTNLIEPALEANGVGKSTLFEALFWVIYGKTSRNLRAGTVKNWNYKGRCHVSLAFEQYGMVYLLSRSWSPNKLLLQKESEKPHEIDQEKLETLIGLSAEAFLCSLYFAQFVPSFVDLEPASRMALYSSVLKLDSWEERGAKAADYANKLERQCTTLLGEISTEEALIQELEGQNWRTQEQQWKQEQDLSLKRINVELERETATLQQLEKKLAALGPVEQNANAKLTELNAEAKHIEREIDRLTRLKIGYCGNCRQEITGPHLARERNALALKHHALKSEAKTLEKSAVEETKKAEKALSLNSEIVRWREVVALHTTQFQTATRQQNPYSQHRKESDAKLAAKRQLITKKRTELEESEVLQKATSFWAKGFKDVRLLLIEESLEQLNIEVNECLYQLGLQNWEVRFDTEQETKSKTIRRGFSCTVSAPGEHTAPWEAWSGGESQRLRMAISMGISNLITNRIGLVPNIELFDEPSSWLSKCGIDGLLEALQERALRQRKIILLADHRALDFGGFSGIITVTKDEAGSRISETKP